MQQGQAGHPIDIVIAKKHHGLARIDGLQEADNRCFHVRQSEGVAQFLEFGIEKTFCLGPAPDSSLSKQAADQRGLATAIQRCQTVVLHRAQIPLSRYRHKMGSVGDSPLTQDCNPSCVFPWIGSVGSPGTRNPGSLFFA